ncbi:hypothetical protein [Oribacterium sp. WCC10]|uniref:hypothetical protein n=1 Tax=Oribacterium sp. WCC10 TaxID=1855343 RepID=UPI0008DEEC37|nr:hypothetical protein [Oribacterium sp. WCC10]SFG39466.1 hypothetical protein SAMN05216356_10784 [Oribacterium sp. WCC10]
MNNHFNIKKHIKNNTHNMKPLWRDWLTYDLVFGISLQIFIFLFSMFFWSMRFPKLTFEKATVLNLLYLSLFLPFFTGLLGLWARTYESRSWTKFFTAISFPSLIIGIIATVFLCILPPYCSGTTEVHNYMKFDDDIDAITRDTVDAVFPDIIAADASNISYRYYKYSSILENSFHMSLGETLSDTEFSDESTRLLSLPEFDSAEISNNSDITLIDTVLDNRLIVHITLDDTYKRIIYSIGYNSIN